MTSTLTPLTDLDYKALFLDAVRMMAEIARAAGFDPNDPSVEPPAIVARVENMRAERDTLRADLAAAAGELMVPIPEPGTDASRMLLANVLMRRERTELRLTLAAERGLPEGAVSEGWASFGGLLREWQKRYPDGTEAQVRADGRWWRGYRGELPSWPDRPGRRAQTIAEGPAGLKRAGMLAADAALSGEG